MFENMFIEPILRTKKFRSCITSKGRYFREGIVNQGNTQFSALRSKFKKSATLTVPNAISRLVLVFDMNVSEINFIW